eukprot:gene3047-3508_t
MDKYKFALSAIFSWLILLVNCRESECSWGDRSPKFDLCLYYNEHLCDATTNHHQYPSVLPMYLSMFAWTCFDELKYQCMHNVTQEYLEEGVPVMQFYGKWPFVRLFGIQEPASTLFSLGNMLSHIFGWLKFSRNVSNKYKFYGISKLYCLVSINAWIWSTVFHTRDLPVTEKLDYFCASLTVISSIVFCFTRLVGDPHNSMCYVFNLMIFVVYCVHVYIMSFIKFDFVYNMKFNIGIGIVNLIMWLCWCLLRRKERPYAWKCAFIVIATSLCLSLELLDFPPIWWIFDAHSLWHLATIPLSYFWYSFLIDDGRYEVTKSEKERKML